MDMTEVRRMLPGCNRDQIRSMYLLCKRFDGRLFHHPIMYGGARVILMSKAYDSIAYYWLNDNKGYWYADYLETTPLSLFTPCEVDAIPTLHMITEGD